MVKAKIKPVAGKKIHPPGIEPMLATLSKDFPAGNDWLYEIKWDGYRIIAVLDGKEIKLLSRSHLNFTKNYRPIAEALSRLNLKAVIDGEVVVLDEKGKPDFDALQRFTTGMNILFYAFDLLWLNGKSLLELPLTERKAALRKIIPADDAYIKLSEDFEDGKALFEQAQQLSLEGVVAKKKDSHYLPGKRTKYWLKLPTAIRQEFVIGGWTVSDNRRFRSLLFGYYEKGKLMYLGHAGLGFKDKEMPGILSKLKKLEVKKSPFSNDVDTDREVHYVKPELVAEIKFATFTDSGKIRKPAIFLGFRKDKKAEDVKKEIDLLKKEIAAPVDDKPKVSGSTAKLSSESNWRKLRSLPISSSDTFNIDGKEILLENIEKEIWRGITKADLIQYYHSIAPYILPYIKDRPQSMHIKYAGVSKPGLYIKDMEGQQPDWAEVFSIKRKHKKSGRRNIIDYLVCNDEATLLYMINLGCIDVNPWNARTHNPHEPDYIVIDLDPSDDDFQKVIRTAKAARIIFDKHNLAAYPKTSGKTGMHLYIPCSGINFPQARAIAEKICKEIHTLVPDFTTTAVSISQRGDKLYIDPNQNDEADTLAAPYSARPYHLPTVSTPLEWKEINEKLDPKKFTIKTIATRLKKGDLFKPIFDKKIIKKNNMALAKYTSE